MSQPPISMLCGDEVPAVVADIGTGMCKFGCSGQDQPRFSFRSQVGVRQVDEMEVEDGTVASKPKHLCGDMELRTQQDMEICNLCSQDGEINWDYVESVFKYGVEGCMRLDMKEYPMMLTESMFSSFSSKEKLLEMCFELFECPGIFIARDGVLASFSAGRPTSLVVDLGASGTRIVPVVDGYGLEKAIVSTSRGGNWIDNKLMDAFNSLDYEIKPWFEAKDKQLTKGTKKGAIRMAPKLQSSFVEAHRMDIVRDAKTWMCFIPNALLEGQARTEFISKMNMPPYELPDGTKVEAHENICLAAEELIVGAPDTPAGALVDKLPLPNSNAYMVPPHAMENRINPEKDGLPMLIASAISKCDVDVRRTLLQNVLMIGGGSLMDGLSARVVGDLAKLLPPNFRPKMVSLLPVEKDKAAWIGGSVLSICGSFQQMWLSKAEWDEHGSSIIGQRFNK